MKLLKRMAVLSLCVLALSACTKSSISTDAPVAATQAADVDDGEGVPADYIDPAKMEEEEEIVEKVELVEDETYEITLFDWEQVDDETADLFGDTGFYQEGVEMTYAADEDARTIELNWVLKNGTTEDVAMEYATDMVQKFNNILAVQTGDIEEATMESFGGVWEQFALSVNISTEDGTVLIEKSYNAGDAIDLKLPEYSGEGPTVGETEKTSPVKPQ